MSHIHDDGRLSSVYYVSVPKTSSVNPRAGCLVLGSSEHNGPSVHPPWGTRDVHPSRSASIVPILHTACDNPDEIDQSENLHFI